MPTAGALLHGCARGPSTGPARVPTTCAAAAARREEATWSTA